LQTGIDITNLLPYLGILYVFNTIFVILNTVYMLYDLLNRSAVADNQLYTLGVTQTRSNNTNR
jgi:hypothetical protein